MVMGIAQMITGRIFPRPTTSQAWEQQRILSRSQGCRLRSAQARTMLKERQWDMRTGHSLDCVSLI